jgi:hypothetical protein
MKMERFHVVIMMYDHIPQSGAASRESGAAFRATINAGKACVIRYNRRVAVAGGLCYCPRQTFLAARVKLDEVIVPAS